MIGLLQRGEVGWVGERREGRGGYERRREGLDGEVERENDDHYN